jgi:prephenate dehydrogenase
MGLVRHVTGCARSEDTLRVASARGLVDEVSCDPAAATRGADVVVLAVPVGAMRDVAAAVVRGVRPGTIITDVGSVKREVLDRVEPLCREAGCLFVGGHPVAGREGGGPAAADDTLFRGHRCILTPTSATDAEALARVRALWEGVGMRVEEMDADTHDRILARVSHAPHLIAYALAAAVGEARAGERAVAAYAGSGFRDTTRIAASAAELWRDIALANREQVLEALREFESRLRALEDLLGRGDASALERALAGASRHRRAIGSGGR